MIEFMVIAAPRSGTTWASNWLTTEKTTCLHDPLWKYRVDELDLIKTNKMLGVSCTGLYLVPKWVENHPARKVILHRDLDEINKSCELRGMPLVSKEAVKNLDLLNGLHVHWKELFDNPKMIYEYLLQEPFDKERHDVLKELNVQSTLENIVVDREVGLRFFSQLTEVMNGLL